MEIRGWWFSIDVEIFLEKEETKKGRKPKEREEAKGKGRKEKEWKGEEEEEKETECKWKNRTTYFFNIIVENRGYYGFPIFTVFLGFNPKSSHTKTEKIDFLLEIFIFLLLLYKTLFLFGHEKKKNRVRVVRQLQKKKKKKKGGTIQPSLCARDYLFWNAKLAEM